MIVETTKQKILFLIHTEFVLLVSLLYFFKYFKNKNIEPVFAVLNNNKNRFNEIDFDLFPGKVLILKNDLNTSVLKPNKEFLKLLKIENISELCVQNPNIILSYSLINSLKKKNKDLILTYIPDSLGVDNIRSIRDTIVYHIFLYIRKFVNKIPHLPMKLMTEKKFAEKSNKIVSYRKFKSVENISILELLKEIPQINEISRIFGSSIDIYQQCNIIFYTQPILKHSSITEDVKNNYLNVLNFLVEKVNDSKLKMVIKVHPGESINDYLKYENNNIKIDKKSNVPAEIVLNSIKNKVIISFWSGISIFDANNQNKHFWLHKIINYNISVKTQHELITCLNTKEELKNLIENIKD